MSVDGGGNFEPKAWTPARTALWEALSPEDKKVLEKWVAQGSTDPVPEQWVEIYKSLADLKVESVVPDRIFKHMGGKIGWTVPVIENVYAPQFRKKAAEAGKDGDGASQEQAAQTKP